MEGRGPGVGENQAIWRALLEAEYFQIPIFECTTCRNKNAEKCGTYFCLTCKVGNVCPVTFENGGAHANHPRIRIWLVTRAFVVREDDLRRFLPEVLVNQIKLYKANHHNHCKFTRTSSSASGEACSTSRQPICYACNLPIGSSTVPNESERPVCSLKCLLDDALAQRVNHLIAALDARRPRDWDLIAAPEGRRVR